MENFNDDPIKEVDENNRQAVEEEKENRISEQFDEEEEIGGHVEDRYSPQEEMDKTVKELLSTKFYV